jgi:L-alanine-DL-glutamate epimerase-like enolase superfamily enzyme
MFTNEKPGGHGERSVAIGTLDMAIWDAVAKIADMPLFALLAQRYGDGEVDRRVFVYAAGGYYYPGQDLSRLQDEMKRYLDRGYTVVKQKIGGAPLADDLRRIEAVLSILPAHCRLAVDANGRFDLDTPSSTPRRCRATTSSGTRSPATRSTSSCRRRCATIIQSDGDGRGPVLHAGCAQPDPLRRHAADRDWLQFDCALSYGLVEYLRTLAMLREHGWSARRCIPHGGHQMSLNIAAGLKLGGNESYPDLFQPFGGFPDGVRVESGYITMPDLPGIGFEGKADLYEVMSDLAR